MLVVDQMSKSTKFKILKFNGKGFVMWKVEIRTILLKDGCAIEGMWNKPAAMTHA